MCAVKNAPWLTQGLQEQTPWNPSKSTDSFAWPQTELDQAVLGISFIVEMLSFTSLKYHTSNHISSFSVKAVSAFYIQTFQTREARNKHGTLQGKRIWNRISKVTFPVSENVCVCFLYSSGFENVKVAKKNQLPELRRLHIAIWVSLASTQERKTKHVGLFSAIFS